MSITCEKATYLMMLSLNGELEEADKVQLDHHVASCSVCLQEMVQMQQVHNLLSSLPVPEPDMQLMNVRFYDMLDEYKQATANAHNGWFTQLKEYLQAYWQPSYTLQLAMGFLLLLIGWGGSYVFYSRTNTQSQQIN